MANILQINVQEKFKLKDNFSHFTVRSRKIIADLS